MTTVYEQFLEQRGRLARAYIAPTAIVFSSEGHMKAMRENRENGAFVPATSPGGLPSYSGLPYSIDKEQKEDIKVLNAMTHSPGNRAIRFAMSGTFGKLSGEEPKTMIEVIAQSLDAATLCNIIRAWLDNDDATHWGKFERGLDRLLETHGRFE